MRNISKTLIIISIFITDLFALDKSLFMSSTESEKVLSMLDNDKQKGNIDTTSFKITGIMFNDDLNWIVWINDKPYTTIGEKEGFSIDSVSERNVLLTKSDGTTLDLEVGP